MTRRLIALDLAPGDRFVAELLRIWDDGDAVLPVDQRLPVAAKRALLERQRVAAVVTSSGVETWPGAAAVGHDDALVVPTSGSTGAPKGVTLTHAAIAASAQATSARLGITADHHWLACLPLGHIGGLSVVTRALHAGTGLTVLPRFEPAAVMRAAQLGATHVSLVATALRQIDSAVFERIVLGGSRPPADRPSNSVITYGMTETGSGIVYDRTPLDGVDLKIVDGEIYVRGPMLLRCYRGGDPFETDPLVDGWLATGDSGALDDDGVLAVDGRKGDLIISGGENVWPEPIEARLRQVPGVADVAVVGRPDPKWGEVVTAIVVPAADTVPTLAQLRAAVKQDLPAYCAPHQLELTTTIKRSIIGKIIRSELSP